MVSTMETNIPIQSWSPYQEAVFRFVEQGTGNGIVEAVAGSGKTTTIVEATRRMDGFVFLGAYNTKMGKELQERTAGMTNVQAGTFHSVGFKALRFHCKGYRLELDEKKVIKIAQSIAENGRPDLEALVSGVTRIVSMAKQRGIGALHSITDTGVWMDMIDHFGFEEDIPEGVDLFKVVKFAQVVLNKSNQDLNTIDFDDMVYLPLQKGLRTLQFDWVLIDEAQDTNPTRRALARKLLRPGTGRLIAVGDPRQAIFGFTGADNDSLEQIARDFAAIRLPLTISYRCPKAVVRHAQNWVSHIEAHESAPEGSFTTLPYSDLMTDLKIGDAVLCRFNKYLVNTAFKLIRKGVPAKMEGRAIGEGLVKLASRWKVKGLDALEARLEKFQDRELAKASAKGNDAKADQIVDKVDTLRALIDRGREQGVQTVAELREMILSLFEDAAGTRKPCVVLSSVHRSKGLEWNRVFLLGRDEFMPSSMARTDWAKEQELNLIYVAVTRAKEALVEVTGVKAGDQARPAKIEEVQNTTAEEIVQ